MADYSQVQLTALADIAIAAQIAVDNAIVAEDDGQLVALILPAKDLQALRLALASYPNTVD